MWVQLILLLVIVVLVLVLVLQYFSYCYCIGSDVIIVCSGLLVCNCCEILFVCIYNVEVWQNLLYWLFGVVELCLELVGGVWLEVEMWVLKLDQVLVLEWLVCQCGQVLQIVDVVVIFLIIGVDIEQVLLCLLSWDVVCMGLFFNRGWVLVIVVFGVLFQIVLCLVMDVVIQCGGREVFGYVSYLYFGMVGVFLLLVVVLLLGWLVLCVLLVVLILLCYYGFIFSEQDCWLIVLVGLVS